MAKKNSTAATPQDIVNRSVWQACEIFRGLVEPQIRRDYVLALLFLRIISDDCQAYAERLREQYGDHPELIDEMMKNARFILPRHCVFSTLHARRHEPGNGERIDKALQEIEACNLHKLNNVFREISFNSFLLGTETQKNEVLQCLLESLARPELDLRRTSDVAPAAIRTAFEFLIRESAASNDGEGCECYTPPEVARLLAQLVAPQEGDDICDPTCGSGSLLAQCGNLIRQRGSTLHHSLYGQEARGTSWALARMNLFVHGEDNQRIEWGDTIRNPLLVTDQGLLRRFDIVVANPPYSHPDWGHDIALKDKYQRFGYGMPPKTRGEYAFILHMIETMKPGSGRMAVVVPHGVLFRGTNEGAIRKRLIEGNLLDAVIGLPEKLFYGRTHPAAILVFRKNKSDDKVLFIDASHDCQPGKNHNVLREKDLARIVSAVHARKNLEHYAALVGVEEMARHDFNLNISRYVDSFAEKSVGEPAPLRAEHKRLMADLAAVEIELDGYLLELGGCSR